MLPLPYFNVIDCDLGSSYRNSRVAGYSAICLVLVRVDAETKVDE